MLMPFIKSRLDDHELEETKEENVKEMYHEVEKLFINCNKIHQQKSVVIITIKHFYNDRS